MSAAPARPWASSTSRTLPTTPPCALLAALGVARPGDRPGLTEARAVVVRRAGYTVTGARLPVALASFTVADVAAWLDLGKPAAASYVADLEREGTLVRVAGGPRGTRRFRVDGRAVGAVWRAARTWARRRYLGAVAQVVPWRRRLLRDLVALVARELDGRGDRTWTTSVAGLATLLGVDRRRLRRELHRAADVGLLAHRGRVDRMRFRVALGPVALGQPTATASRESADRIAGAPLTASQAPPFNETPRDVRDSVSTRQDGLDTRAEHRPSARVETRASEKRPQRHPWSSAASASSARQRHLNQTPGPARPPDLRRRIERWRVDHGQLSGALNPDDIEHVAAVDGLLQAIGFNNLPVDLREGPPSRRTRREAALRHERARFVRRLMRWAGTFDDLASWLLRVIGKHRPRSLARYLRAAVAKGGDPGRLLLSQAKNELGRGAEDLTDYGRTTELELQGERAAECRRLVAGLAIGKAPMGEDHRTRLREDMQTLFGRGDRCGARRVALRILGGTDPGDLEDGELSELFGLPPRQARELLEVA